MPAGPSGSSRHGARDQLIPKGDGESSSSPVHSMPPYELSLPGTLPVAQSAEAAPPHLAKATDGPGGHREAVNVANGGPRPAGSAAPNGVTHVPASMDIQQALLPPVPAPEFQHPISPARRRWMVFVFCLVAGLLFADQNLLAPNLTAAAQYFGMDERQKDVLLGGLLNAAFFMVGAPAALVVGWLADRGSVNRRTLLFWVVCVGTTPCLLTYWVRAYWQFFLLRALTGVAVGGCFPLVFSLLGDLFPPSKRAAVSAVVQIATGAGLAAGQALAGSLGPATNWRLPFVVVAAPCLGVAGLMLATTVDPPRGAYEEALRERYAEGSLSSYEGSISWPAVRSLLRCPSNALIIAQGLPGSLPWGMVASYINDFLSQQKGFSVQAATLVLLFFGGGGAVGVIGGGAGGQWLYNRKKEYQALLAGGCVLAGIGPLYALINADLQSIGLGASCFLAGLAGCVASVAGPNVRAVLLNVNEPERRGTALALQSTTDDVGKGLGPVMVAGLIRVLGRKGAFNVSTFGWVPCGALILGLAACMRRDEAAMQARLAAASEAAAAAAEAAEAEAGGRGGGIQLPPPPLGSEGGAGPAAAGGAGGASAGSGAVSAAEAEAGAAVVAGRHEERRLARVPLLGSGPSSDDPDTAAGSHGGAAAAEAGVEQAGRVGPLSSAQQCGDGEAQPPLPLSTAALEVEAGAGRAGAGPWGPQQQRSAGLGAPAAGAAQLAPLHADPSPPPPPPLVLPSDQQRQQQPQQAHPSSLHTRPSLGAGDGGGSGGGGNSSFPPLALSPPGLMPGHAPAAARAPLDPPHSQLRGPEAPGPGAGSAAAAAAPPGPHSAEPPALEVPAPAAAAAGELEAVAGPSPGGGGGGGGVVPADEAPREAGPEVPWQRAQRERQ